MTHWSSTEDLESQGSPPESFAYVESSDPSFINAGESGCTIDAESPVSSARECLSPDDVRWGPSDEDDSVIDEEGPDVPPLPSQVEQEMDELLARSREFQSTGSWSEVHTLSSYQSPPRRPNMVYFLTLQEQRLATAPIEPPAPSPRRRRPRRRRNYELDAHCCLREARIAEEVSARRNGTPPRATEEVHKVEDRRLLLDKLRPEARAWSPLRASSPRKTPGGTASTWMGSEMEVEPPNTASTDAREATELPGLRLTGSRLVTTKERRRCKVPWLPPLRQVPAPKHSVLSARNSRWMQEPL
ncbi:unnamed protein product [Effrenium voratum]|uniref:Uncharacterized protein n=1 Tax=Effrenium voratum TaxID=2562239 RepID=A0AA36NFU3_9DINO|nr:unnamed protein product [Effrenium voratum]